MFHLRRDNFQIIFALRSLIECYTSLDSRISLQLFHSTRVEIDWLSDFFSTSYSLPAWCRIEWKKRKFLFWALLTRRLYNNKAENVGNKNYKNLSRRPFFVWKSCEFISLQIDSEISFSDDFNFFLPLHVFWDLKGSLGSSAKYLNRAREMWNAKDVLRVHIEEEEMPSVIVNGNLNTAQRWIYPIESTAQNPISRSMFEAFVQKKFAIIKTSKHKRMNIRSSIIDWCKVL